MFPTLLLHNVRGRENCISSTNIECTIHSGRHLFGDTPKYPILSLHHADCELPTTDNTLQQLGGNEQKESRTTEQALFGSAHPAWGYANREKAPPINSAHMNGQTNEHKVNTFWEVPCSRTGSQCA